MRVSYGVLTTMANAGDPDAANAVDVWDKLEGGMPTLKVEAHFHVAQDRGIRIERYEIVDNRGAQPRRTYTKLGIKVVTPAGSFRPHNPTIQGFPAITQDMISRAFDESVLPSVEVGTDLRVKGDK